MSASDLAKLYKVTTPHNASYPDPITFSRGDKLTTGKPDPDHPGWIWCVNAEGKSGWVPKEFLKIESTQATTLRDYDAKELTVGQGELVTVIEAISGWSWCETDDKRRGWMPTKCLTALTSPDL